MTPLKFESFDRDHAEFGVSLKTALRLRSSAGRHDRWRYLASLLSIAAGKPGGRLHDSMSLGLLLAAPPRFLPPESQALLAAIGATALFAAANRTPLFCALFVFTLQGDPQLLLPLLLASAISAALAEPLRGRTWNEAQVAAF